MKRFFFGSGNHGPAASLGLLILRLTGALMLIGHGWGKLQKMSENVDKWADPLGIGSQWSLYGTIGAEVGCAALIVLGLFTRLSAVGLAFTMGVAAFMVHQADPLFAKAPPSKEMALLYLIPALTLLFTGAGKFSLDGVIGGGGGGKSSSAE